MLAPKKYDEDPGTGGTERHGPAASPADLLLVVEVQGFAPLHRRLVLIAGLVD
ncbi:MAG: hypothetical protein H0V10_08640 [Geodermatophilaceae bacterium]|nr:hypothetical protein [Geodermatophilaceae bacterium]